VILSGNTSELNNKIVYVRIYSDCAAVDFLLEIEATIYNGLESLGHQLNEGHHVVIWFVQAIVLVVFSSYLVCHTRLDAVRCSVITVWSCGIR
jgi:hypothetical protein